MVAVDRTSVEETVRSLRAYGVAGVALVHVDNSGVQRVKSVPVDRLAQAIETGVGMSPVVDTFLVNDHTTTRTSGGPVGALRLFPDLDAVSVLAAQPGWAWAPVDRRTQTGDRHPVCQRGFAKEMVDRAHQRGIDLKMAFEVEWALGIDAEDFVPATRSAAYSMNRLVERSGYCA